MRNNNNRSDAQEYVDIPLNPDSTPLHMTEKLNTYTFPKTPIEIGFDFLTRLDDAIRQKNTQ